MLAAQIGGLAPRFGLLQPPMIRPAVYLFLFIVRSQWRGLHSSSGLSAGSTSERSIITNQDTLVDDRITPE